MKQNYLVRGWASVQWPSIMFVRIVNLAVMVPFEFQIFPIFLLNFCNFCNFFFDYFRLDLSFEFENFKNGYVGTIILFEIVKSW